MARAAALLALVALSFGCTKDRDNEKAKQRLWGRETIPTEAETLAKESLDAALIADDTKARARVLAMGMDELYARFGFFKYEGTAKLDLKSGEQHLRVEEKSTIEHGLHGDFRVVQTGAEEEPLREIVYHGGILFIRNSGGDLRVQGIVNRQHKAVRDEAWEPLRVYTGYFGERLSLKPVGTANHQGRNAVKYQLRLGPGPELVGKDTKDGAKRPVSLDGELWVDAETAVPVKCHLAGVLEVPGKEGEGAPAVGTLEVSLDMNLASVPGKELKPEKYVPTIRRHPTDLEPLAFLEGETKTSTVIGGPKVGAEPAKPKVGAEPAEPAEPKVEATAKPAADPAKPAKPSKKKKKKKKKER